LWNDPAIAKLNPDMKLPDLPIQVLHRTEGKAPTTFFPTISPKSAGISCRRRAQRIAKMAGGPELPAFAGLVAKLRGTPGAIGYTELNLAAGSVVRMASIKNAAGEFVKPSAKSIAAAASASGNKLSNDFRVSLTNASGKESYPISSFTWLYVPAIANDPGRAARWPAT